MASDTTTSTTTTKNTEAVNDTNDDDVFVVSLIQSTAPLLSGNSIYDCQFPTDETCVGGIASVRALQRWYTTRTTRTTTTEDGEQEEQEIIEIIEPSFLLQKLDMSSPFVNLHPLQWIINRFIFQNIFPNDISIFTSTPSLLLQNRIDKGSTSTSTSSVSQRDISELQTKELPFLLSHVMIPPSHSWYEYLKVVHFDPITQTVHINIVDSNVPFTINAVDATRGIMNYIYKINVENECYTTTTTENDGDTTTTTSTSTSTTILSSPGSTTTTYDEYFQKVVATTNLTMSSSSSSSQQQQEEETSKICWISVVYFSDIEANFHTYMDGITGTTSSSSSSTSTSSSSSSSSSSSVPIVEHKPDLIIVLDYTYTIVTKPQLYNNSTNSSIWISQCGAHPTTYCHHRLTISTSKSSSSPSSSSKSRIQNIELIQHDLHTDVTTEMKDTKEWNRTIIALRQLANDAIDYNPMIGTIGYIPPIRIGSYRACKAGECSVGNLFTDAIQWYSNVDFAFTTSGGYRGLGLGNDTVDNGPIYYNDLFATLPFPNTICTGRMNGDSLFQLLNYTTSIATFEGEDTSDGGRLLQVSSGIKVTYNTNLNPNIGRLVNVELWNSNLEMYEPLQRQKLYTFATDSFVCSAYHPYPELTVHNLQQVNDDDDDDSNDEIPGQIEEYLHHEIVAEYLTQLLPLAYNTSIHGRLVNDTSISQEESMSYKYYQLLNGDNGDNNSNCPRNTIWNDDTLLCIPCPSYNHVFFSDDKIQLQVNLQKQTIDHDADADNDQQQQPLLPHGRIILANREAFSVIVVPKSQPKWFEYTSAMIGEIPINSTLVLRGEGEGEEGSTTRTEDDDNDDDVIRLESGESLVLEFDLDPSALSNSGTDRTALATVSFGIQDGGQQQQRYLGCYSQQDVTFDVELRITPSEELNQLGWIRYLGVGLMGICCCSALFFLAWVYQNRQARVVKVMQPLFLFQICIGVIILSAAIIPLSMDDELLVVEHNNNDGDDGSTTTTGQLDIACMCVPWLMSTGFTIAFSALFSKLWRINTLFDSGTALRRVTVKVRDVLAPFAVLFSLNVILLTVWTIVDPLRFIRQPINVGEDWNTYGSCTSEGRTSTIIVSLLCALNSAALFLACHQAYRARNISCEFSESKYIGIAIYGWFQILVVATPVMFLLGRDNPTAHYFLSVAIIFLVSMSVLIIVLAPAYINLRTFYTVSSRRYVGSSNLVSNRRVVGASGRSRNISGLHPPDNFNSVRSSTNYSPKPSPSPYVAGGGQRTISNKLAPILKSNLPPTIPLKAPESSSHSDDSSRNDQHFDKGQLESNLKQTQTNVEQPIEEPVSSSSIDMMGRRVYNHTGSSMPSLASFSGIDDQKEEENVERMNKANEDDSDIDTGKKNEPNVIVVVPDSKNDGTVEMGGEKDDDDDDDVDDDDDDDEREISV